MLRTDSEGTRHFKIYTGLAHDKLKASLVLLLRADITAAVTHCVTADELHVLVCCGICETWCHVLHVIQQHWTQRELCMYVVALLAGAVNSLGVVLGQEMQRFNRLLHHVTASLQQLIKALKVQSPTHKTLGPTPLSSIIF